MVGAIEAMDIAMEFQPTLFWATTNVSTMPKIKKPTNREIAPSIINFVDILPRVMANHHHTPPNLSGQYSFNINC